MHTTKENKWFRKLVLGESIRQLMGCNGKIPTCVQGRAWSRRIVLETRIMRRDYGVPLEVVGNNNPR